MLTNNAYITRANVLSQFFTLCTFLTVLPKIFIEICGYTFLFGIKYVLVLKKKFLCLCFVQYQIFVHQKLLHNHFVTNINDININI